MSQALQFLFLTTAAWLNRQQEGTIDFLREGNRVFHDHLGSKQTHFTDPQRKRLAMRGKWLRRQVLAGLDNRLLSEPPPPKPDDPVRRRERISRLLNYYHWKAA